MPSEGDCPRFTDLSLSTVVESGLSPKRNNFSMNRGTHSAGGCTQLRNPPFFSGFADWRTAPEAQDMESSDGRNMSVIGNTVKDVPGT